MSIYLKIFFLLGFMILFHKVNAQIDTLNYLKQFETNKIKYINQPFSKLLNDMSELKPLSVYTQKGGCHYDTQFYFTDAKKGLSSSYKINIVWQNSVYYKDEHILNLNEIYSLTDTKDQYKKYIIKNIEFNYQGEFYVLSLRTKSIDKDTDSYNRIDSYLKTNKKNILNNSFFNFVCWLRPMNLTRIKNIYDKSKTVAPQTEFIVVNPYNKRKKAKIIVEWESPISKNEIQEYKKKNGNHYDKNKRSFYVEKIVKDIKAYR